MYKFSLNEMGGSDMSREKQNIGRVPQKRGTPNLILWYLIAVYFPVIGNMKPHHP